MSVELHLPDLPEVPISLGPGRPSERSLARAWHVRLRQRLASLLPLLVMALLALASWWLVRNSPQPSAPVVERVASHMPDYAMQGFALERFDPSGRLRLRIEGERLQHFPDTDLIQIDAAVIRAIAQDGHVTLAHARRALSNGDSSEVQLLGDAVVSSANLDGSLLVMRSEALDFFVVAERVTSNVPVEVLFGATELRAAGLVYDHAAQHLDLEGPMRAVLPPPAAASEPPA